MIRETDQLQPALLHLAPYRIPELRLFRRNILRARIGDRVICAGIKGQCDIYGIARGGRHIELELKAARGSLQAQQRVWAEWCAAWQVPYLALKARSRESCLQTAERWCMEIRDALEL